jgi:hypothetical protein
VADRDEGAGHRQIALLAGLHVLHARAAERAIVAGEELVHHVGGEELDVLHLLGPAEHDL